jgi:hypothetical protein
VEVSDVVKPGAGFAAPEVFMEEASTVMVDGPTATDDLCPIPYPKPKKTAQTSAIRKKIPRIVGAPRDISRSLGLSSNSSSS